MAEKLLQIDIQLQPDGNNTTSIVNGDRFTYQINENFQGLPYFDNPPLVDKEFVVAEEITKGSIATFSNNQYEETLGSFNQGVETILPFNLRGTDLLAIGGAFTSYTFNGTTTNATFFIVLEENGEVFRPNDIDYENLLDDVRVGSKVKDIKFHEINQSLVLVGKFDYDTTPFTVFDFFELDMNTYEESSRIFYYSQGNGVRVSSEGINAVDIRQDLGTIVIVGGFNQVYRFNAARIFFFNKDLESTSKVLLDNTYNNFDDSPNAVSVTQTGDFKTLVAGKFTYTESITQTTQSNLVELNVLGRYISSFQGTDDTINSIHRSFSSIYLGGQFDNYGVQPADKIAKTNNVGVLDTNFSTEIPDIITILEIGGGEGTNIHVAGSMASGAYNFTGIQADGSLVNRLNFDTNPLTLKYSLDSKLYVGGNFTEFSTIDIELNKNQILATGDLAITRNNIFDNLVEHNSRGGDLGFSYAKIGSDIIRLTKIIENTSDIYFITNVQNIEDKLTVSVSRNDGNLADTIVNIPIRKDFIVKNEQRSDWSSADFSLSVFEGASNKTLDNTTVISKQRISDAQLNQYINISPLINQQSLESDITYYNELDYGTQSPQINISKIGRFGSIEVDTLLQDTILVTKRDISFILDGYNSPKAVMINGNKREFYKEGKIAIPFLSSAIKEIEVIDGNVSNTVINPNFENVNPEKPEDYISYLCLDYTQYFNQSKTTLIFKDTDGVVDTITLFQANASSLFNTFKVIFKNSFGVLENCYMGGRSIDSVDTDSSSFKRDIVDVNGETTNPLIHTNKVFNKVGSREWECNTGLVDEYMNDCYEDLFMSEEVWLEYRGETKAVSLEESNFRKEDNLQSDMINYRFRFKEDRKINE